MSFGQAIRLWTQAKVANLSFSAWVIVGSRECEQIGTWGAYRLRSELGHGFRDKTTVNGCDPTQREGGRWYRARRRCPQKKTTEFDSDLSTT